MTDSSSSTILVKPVLGDHSLQAHQLKSLLQNTHPITFNSLTAIPLSSPSNSTAAMLNGGEVPSMIRIPMSMCQMSPSTSMPQSNLIISPIFSNGSTITPSVDCSSNNHHAKPLAISLNGPVSTPETVCVSAITSTPSINAAPVQIVRSNLTGNSQPAKASAVGSSIKKEPSTDKKKSTKQSSAVTIKKEPNKKTSSVKKSKQTNIIVSF